jgi:hypothetical protein
MLCCRASCSCARSTLTPWPVSEQLFKKWGAGLTRACFFAHDCSGFIVASHHAASNAVPKRCCQRQPERFGVAQQSHADAHCPPHSHSPVRQNHHAAQIKLFFLLRIRPERNVASEIPISCPSTHVFCISNLIRYHQLVCCLTFDSLSSSSCRHMGAKAAKGQMHSVVSDSSPSYNSMYRKLTADDSDSHSVHRPEHKQTALTSVQLNELDTAAKWLKLLGNKPVPLYVTNPKSCGRVHLRSGCHRAVTPITLGTVIRESRQLCSLCVEVCFASCFPQQLTLLTASLLCSVPAQTASRFD